jgi:biopolymer transport protein ExbB/TolQ
MDADSREQVEHEDEHEDEHEQGAEPMAPQVLAGITQPGAPMGETGQRVTTDVSTLRSLGLALPLYLALIVGAHAMPDGIRRLLLERGWIPHAVMVLSCWSAAILVLKALSLKVQRRALALEVIPHDMSHVTPATVAHALAHVDTLQQGPDWRRKRSVLLERVRRILEHYAARGDVGETAHVNSADADADAMAVASSFSIVKVMVWAIPILGFIGTVIGIGTAVGGFSQSLEGAQQLDAIKTSLGEVTSGLAVAFDTTLVALVASILVMLPQSWLQKAEEQLINDVDDFCVSHVMRRLADPRPESTRAQDASPDELRGAIMDAVAAPVAEMLAAHGRLMHQLAVDHASLAWTQRSLHDQLSSYVGASRELGPAVQRAVEQLTRATGLAERTTADAERTQAELCRELGASRQLLQLLAAGLSPTARRGGNANGAGHVLADMAEE